MGHSSKSSSHTAANKGSGSKTIRNMKRAVFPENRERRVSHSATSCSSTAHTKLLVGSSSSPSTHSQRPQRAMKSSPAPRLRSKPTSPNVNLGNADSTSAGRIVGTARKQRPGEKGLVAVEKLVWGDGSAARDGRFLKAGQLYGAPNLQGGLESFFPIHICTLSLFDHNCRVPTYDVVAQTTAAKSIPGSRWPRSPRISVPLYQDRYIRRQRMARAIGSWLSAHSGFALFIGGPSARDNVHETAPFIIRDSPQVFMEDNTGDCMLAALVSGIDTLKGGESARTALHKLRRVHTFPYSLKSGMRMVQGLGMKIDVKIS